MNADNIRLYNQLEEYCKELNLEIKLVGSNFSLFVKDTTCLGSFSDLANLASYIYGYETGFSRGKCGCK